MDHHTSADPIVQRLPRRREEGRQKAQIEDELVHHPGGGAHERSPPAHGAVILCGNGPDPGEIFTEGHTVGRGKKSMIDHFEKNQYPERILEKGPKLFTALQGSDLFRKDRHEEQRNDHVVDDERDDPSPGRGEAIRSDQVYSPSA